jgi:hypothetical protein
MKKLLKRLYRKLHRKKLLWSYKKKKDTAFNDIPLDCLVEIVGYIGMNEDLLHFALTNKTNLKYVRYILNDIDINMNMDKMHGYSCRTYDKKRYKNEHKFINNLIKDNSTRKFIYDKYYDGTVMLNKKDLLLEFEKRSNRYKEVKIAERNRNVCCCLCIGPMILYGTFSIFIFWPVYLVGIGIFSVFIYPVIWLLTYSRD